MRFGIRGLPLNSDDKLVCVASDSSVVDILASNASVTRLLNIT